METTTPTPKIQLYEQRDFGAKMSAVFSFIRENWKVLLKYISLFFVPICIIQAFCMNMMLSKAGTAIYGVGAVGSTMDEFSMLKQFIGPYLGEIAAALIGGWIIYSLVFALLQAYEEREQGLNNLVFADFKGYFFSNLRKVFIATLVMILLGIAIWIVLILLTAVTPFSLILTIPALISVGIPLILILPSYVLGIREKGILNCVTWSFRNGYRYWGGTFIILLVCTLIACVVVTIFSLPWYGVYITSIFFLSDSGANFSLSGGMGVLMFVFGLIMSFGSYLSSIIVLLALAFQFGHIRESVENITVDEDIQNFDKL